MASIVETIGGMSGYYVLIANLLEHATELAKDYSNFSRRPINKFYSFDLF